MGVYNKYLKKIDKKQKSKTQLKMPETRVPMTLRDHFLQDSFFKSAWEDMETMRSKFFQTSNSMKMLDHENNNSVSKSEEDGWMLPRKWMMSSFLDDKMFNNDDSGVINIKEDETKMEISLNTSGYSPSELTVNVKDDVLVIEGKHEEKSESGHTMVSRQFRRQYGLSQSAKKTEVVSNLSQDGVLVVTVPKEKRIQEIQESKEGRKVEVEHKKSSVNEDTLKSVKERRASVERERKSSAASMESERKVSTNSMERERKSSTSSIGSDKKISTKTSSMVPMNLRDTFFDDPFFKDSWLDIQQSQKSFFSKAQEQFKQQMERMETAMKESINMSSFFDRDWDMDIVKMPKLNLKDEHEMKVTNDSDKLEISLDTAGYKPDELKVTAGQGIISVEAKHEERTQAGEVMVSRHMQRSYPLPANSKPEDVVSNLSKDGVLIISVPNLQQIKQEDRNVPIKMKN